MGEIPFPSVRLGKVITPQIGGKYHLMSVEGIDVYYQDSLSAFYKELTVKFGKIFSVKKLIAV